MSENKGGIVALLPMKAHSERVQGKNFRVFDGKPLFRWMLDTLLSMEQIDLVVINTDARHLLLQHGVDETAKVVIRDRRAEICGDLVSMNRIIEDDLSEVFADVYVMTHTTNPLLSAATIQRALAAFDSAKRAGTADSLFSVRRHQTRFYRADGSPINHDPGNLVRTQDLEPWFEENSNLYLFSRDSFSAAKARVGRRPILFETSTLESVDIDDEEGWEFATVASEYARRERSRP